MAYAIQGASDMVVTTEELDREAWEVVVGEVTARAPSDRLLATPRLFESGLLLRTGGPGVGIRMRIRPIP